MALKGFLDTLDGLNPVIAAEYQKGEDGKFYLQTEGMILKSKFDGKLEESNKKNGELSKQIAELRTLADSRVERAEVEKLQAMLDDMENGKGGEKFKKALEREIAAFKTTADANISKLRSEHQTAAQEAAAARAELKTFKINQAVAAAASEVGLRGKSAPHYLQLASKDFDLDDAGNVIAVKRTRGADGKDVIIPLQGDDYSPVKLSQFIADNHRTSEFDVFFDKGTGTGAPGARPSGTPGGIFITREQAKNPIAYQNAKAAAEKAGQPLQVQPDTNKIF